MEIELDGEIYEWNDKEYDKPYRDPELLHELYYIEEYSLHPIGDFFGVDGKTIKRWLEKGGYSTRSKTEAMRLKTIPELSNAHELQEIYDECGSLRDVADELGVHHEHVRYWMKKHGIERRGRHENRRHRNGLSMYTHDGYEEFVYVYKKERHHLKFHRIQALLKYSLDELAGKDIHHKNHIPWDNRIENLELVDPEDHSSIHGKGNYGVVSDS